MFRAHADGDVAVSCAEPLVQRCTVSGHPAVSVRSPWNTVDLWTADECFLTGTAAEVIPCVEVDHRMVGEGKPGSLTKRFIDVFRSKVSVEGVKI